MHTKCCPTKKKEENMINTEKKAYKKVLDLQWILLICLDLSSEEVLEEVIKDKTLKDLI
jgi:hypothetical protein